MPTLLETASKLDEMLFIGWNSITPIASENVKFDETKEQSYLETRFIPYTINNVNISASTQKRKRAIGVLFINIRVPLGDGIGLAYNYVNKIQEIMDNKNPLPNLFTETSDVNRIGDTENGWFNLTCEVPFISDDT